MKNSFKTIFLTLLFVSLKFSLVQASCFVEANEGETFFTLFSLYYERDQHITTNYRKGTFIPINTPVTFIKANQREIIVSIYGRKITFVNVPKYSGENIQGIFNRTFGRFPVNLDEYSDQEKQNILSGNVEIGMCKEAVILAIGYPPNHKTPSLLLPQWRYWRSKFGTFIIYFTNDNVSGFKGFRSEGVN